MKKMKNSVFMAVAGLCAATLLALADSARAGSTTPADEAGTVIPGPAAHDWFGAAVAIAGDVTGNGRSEILIGAPVSDIDSANRPGSAYVVDGASGKILLTLEGEANGDKFGAAVAGLGDVNGDGHSDLLIGAPGNDAGGENAGRAYVYSGKTGETIFTLTGEAAGDWFGFSVAAAGDVNGDGTPDFIIGARSPSNGRPGFAYVYSGATGGLLYVVEGEAPGQHFGFGVAGGGDMSGDGTPDFLVSAPFHPAPGSFGGRAYAFSGANGALLHTFTGEGQSNFFGNALVIPGDITSDGYADIVIGADGAGGGNAGRVYVYSGQHGDLLYTVTGDHENGRFGNGLGRAGDANGDGAADFLVGQRSPGGFFGGTGIGRAHLVSGQTGEILHMFEATEIDDFYGFMVAGGADTTGNGADDVVVGAFASDVGGTQSGRVDVFHGPILPGDPAVPGDLNGDGVVDVFDLLILLSAWGACPPTGDCPADLNNDGVVDVFDLLILLSNWG